MVICKMNCATESCRLNLKFSVTRPFSSQNASFFACRHTVLLQNSWICGLCVYGMAARKMTKGCRMHYPAWPGKESLTNQTVTLNVYCMKWNHATIMFVIYRPTEIFTLEQFILHSSPCNGIVKCELPCKGLNYPSELLTVIKFRWAGPLKFLIWFLQLCCGCIGWVIQP